MFAVSISVPPFSLKKSNRRNEVSRSILLPIRSLPMASALTSIFVLPSFTLFTNQAPLSPLCCGSYGIRRCYIVREWPGLTPPIMTAAPTRLGMVILCTGEPNQPK